MWGRGRWPGYGGAAPPPMRLIAPLSSASVTSRRPTLAWQLASGTDGAHIQICRDRACTTQVTAFDAAGSSGAPANDLPAGTLFWRAYGRIDGVTGQVPSPTWQFSVGVRSAPVNTSWGTTLDVNGDGYADVLVGAFQANPDPSTGHPLGAAHVYHGGPSGLGSSPATTLGPPDGPSQFGASVASAGDVNGDGYSDAIIGAPALGRAYVYLGGASGLASSPAVTLAGPDGGLSLFGWSVASAGDVDGDGYSDVIVGAPSALPSPPTYTGQTYLYRGSASGLDAVPAATLTGPDGGNFGNSVAGAGDVNGDGYADVIIGAPGVDGATGRAYVYLGGASGLQSSSALLPGPDDPPGSFGVVAGAGDVNGDGYADVIVGGPGSGVAHGRAYVYLGGAITGVASTPAVTLTGSDADADQFGTSAAGAGDINDDGYADVMVGAQAVASTTGRAYVFLGGAASGVASAPAVTLESPAPRALFGHALAGAGDVNGDGYADVVVGAPYASKAYVYYAGAAGLAVTPASTITGVGGIGNAVATADPRSPHVRIRRTAGSTRYVGRRCARAT